MSTAGPEADEDREPAFVLRVLKRWRALLVLVPLAAGLAVAAAVGAQMLWAEPPERRDPGPDVTCWDRTEAPASACPVPSGVAGLRWVFPSFTPGRSPCRELVREEALPLEWRCRASLDGEPVQIVYSARTSAEQAVTFLRQRFGDDPRPVAGGQRLVFRLDERTEEGYTLAVAYAREPFVVTVTAATIGLRDRALPRLVEFRPAGQVRIRAR